MSLLTTAGSSSYVLGILDASFWRDLSLFPSVKGYQMRSSGMAHNYAVKKKQRTTVKRSRRCILQSKKKLAEKENRNIKVPGTRSCKWQRDKRL